VRAFRTLFYPELSGCITCAETIDEGLQMIEDAKKCWFSDCLESGMLIPETKNVNNYSGKFKHKKNK